MSDMSKSEHRHSRGLNWHKINGQSFEIVEKFYLGDTIGARGGAFGTAILFFQNWYSLHARLNSHYEAWNYKKKKIKLKIKLQRD